jgi:hypothetical protein
MPQGHVNKRVENGVHDALFANVISLWQVNRSLRCLSQKEMINLGEAGERKLWRRRKKNVGPCRIVDLDFMLTFKSGHYQFDDLSR